MQRVARVCQRQLSYLFTARHYDSMVYAVVMCLSVHHKPELYQKAERRITQTTRAIR